MTWYGKCPLAHDLGTMHRPGNQRSEHETLIAQKQFLGICGRFRAVCRHVGVLSPRYGPHKGFQVLG